MSVAPDDIDQLKADLMEQRRMNELHASSMFELQRQISDLRGKWQSALEDIERLHNKIIKDKKE